MRAHVSEITVPTRSRGLEEVTAEVGAAVRASGIEEGLCTVFIRHTSASLLISENADPAVRRDLEAFFRRLVPDGDPIFRHDAEGPDDMPSHVRAALTRTSLGIPVVGGRLALGTWQGIYRFDLCWQGGSLPLRRVTPGTAEASTVEAEPRNRC